MTSNDAARPHSALPQKQQDQFALRPAALPPDQPPSPAPLTCSAPICRQPGQSMSRRQLLVFVLRVLTLC
ncbi:MAG: hypothetical protein OXF54_19835 [Caldilineaceae bacterium]|nr:hypothetical protein [Caldilineaceae bacterium]